MIISTALGIIVFSTKIFSGETPPYDPIIRVTEGSVEQIPVPDIAEGTWTPKKEYMRGDLVRPNNIGQIVFDIDNGPGLEVQHIKQRPFNPLDINFDDFINGIDFDEFSDAFEAGTAKADFNGDGWVNGDDYDLFSAMWNGTRLAPK